jgi:hypothetical protein
MSVGSRDTDLCDNSLAREKRTFSALRPLAVGAAYFVEEK